MTHAGPHAWAPDEAPSYRCLRETPEGEPCPAVGYRRLRSRRDAAIVEADPEDVAFWEYRREQFARNALAASEGRAPYDEDGEWERREPDRTPAVDEQIREREETSMGNGRTTTRHAWSEADEAALREAVEVVFHSELPEGVERRLSGWSAVAGRLLPDLAVTPDACRTRWGVLLERERVEARRIEDARAAAETRAEEMDAAAAEEPRVVVEPDAWEALAQRIAAWEAESADELTAALCGLRDEGVSLRVDVAAMEDRVVERVLNGVAEQVCTALEEIRRDVAGLLAEWKGGGR